MKKLKIFLKVIAVIVLISASIGAFVFFRYMKPFLNKMKQVEVVQIDKGLTVITGGGGNSAIFTSDSLIVLIDTKMDDAANMLYEKVKLLSKGKKLIVINTHWHPDHVGGNSFYERATIIAGDYGKTAWIKEAKQETLPSVWLKDTMQIRIDVDTLLVFNLSRNVHTTNDVMVYSRNRKILFAGDVILNKQVPVLMGEADVDGYLATFDILNKKFEIQSIVPGHGPIAGIEMIENFRIYFNDMKLAATESDKEDALIEKYKQWNQLPIFMSPEATIKHFKKKE